MEILTEAARVVDRLNGLAAALDTDGVLLATADGSVRPHPALVEARQQQQVLTKLLAQIRVSSTTGADVSSAARHAADARWKGVRRGA